MIDNPIAYCKAEKIIAIDSHYCYIHILLFLFLSIVYYEIYGYRFRMSDELLRYGQDQGSADALWLELCRDDRGSRGRDLRYL